MRPPPDVHDALACLLSYPSHEGTGMRYPDAVRVIGDGCPETAPDLVEFSEKLAGMDPGDLEELFTRTFDNVADRSLEVGWQLFGENYARGILMVRFRGLMRKHDVPERTELPDHLSHVLPLLGRAPADVAAAFAANQVMQAVEKMLEGLRTIESPWMGVLEATRKVLLLHNTEARVPSEAPR